MSDIDALDACDVTVDNAAFTGASRVQGYAVPFEQQTDEAFELACLNLNVPSSLSRRLAPLLRAHGRGSVINVSSIHGCLSTVLATEIRVNAFAPGGIERGQAPEFIERYERLTPLGRMATEDDFRGIVTWLAGDASAYVTGQVIAVDGGWTAW